MSDIQTSSGQLDQLAVMLRQRQQRLFIVEASAGGAVQANLSAPAGASAWLLGGLNCYHDSIKTGVLGLDAAVLLQHGAVSQAAILAMAELGLQLSAADWVMVESGVYGPSGGSPQKPVGLVMTCVANALHSECQALQLQGTRESLKGQVAQHLVEQLLQALNNENLAE